MFICYETIRQLKRESMEKWTALSIVLYTMLTLKCYTSSQPPGYIGCFNEALGRANISYRVGRNNGTYCMRFCSRYKIAGTKGQYCKCYGINVTLNQSVEAECSYTCSGRRWEHCGGNNTISLYNISYSKEPSKQNNLTITCHVDIQEFSLVRNILETVRISFCPRETDIITTNKTPQITTTAEAERPTSPKTSHKKSSTTHPSEPLSTEVFVTENVTSNFNNTVDSSTSVAVDSSTSVTVDSSTSVTVDSSTSVAVDSSTSVTVDSSTSVTVDSSTSVTVDSSTSVSNETGNLHAEDSASTAITVGISIPSVIAVAGLTILIICLCARRRRRKSEQRAKYQGNLPTTKCHNSDNETSSENNKLLENSNVDNYKPTTSQCNTGAEYSTVSVHPENSPESIQPCSTSATCAIYSHLQVPQRISKISPAENSYSHIGAFKLHEQPKHSKDEAENTYNSLQSAQRTNNANKMSNDNGDQDSVYDKAIVGGKLPVRHAILNNEYAQLKTVNTTKTVKEQEQSTTHKETVLNGENDKETEFYEQVDEADHHYFILEPQK